MSQIFIAIILIFGAVIIGVFYLNPAWHDFQDLRSTTQDLQEISGELDDLIQNRDTLINRINATSKADLDRLEHTIPQGTQAATFLVELESVTLQHGLHIKAIDLATASNAGSVASSPGKGQPKPTATTPVGSKTKTTLHELPFNITVSGSYQAIKDFINDLERNAPFIDILSISFNSSQKVDLFEMSIKAKTYYQ